MTAIGTAATQDANGLDVFDSVTVESLFENVGTLPDSCMIP